MRRSIVMLWGTALMILVGCNFPTQDDTTLTPDAIIEETIVPLPAVTNTPMFTDTPAPTDTPTLTPTPTEEPTLVAMEPTPTFTEPAPPTDIPPPPTETPGPWEYVVQPNEQLIEIIQRDPFNYRTLDVIPEIVAINPNITSADLLPVGETILIPRPTAIPIEEAPPESVEESDEPPVSVEVEPEEIIAQANPETANIPEIRTRSNYFVPPGYVLAPYQVREGDTAVTIAERVDGLTLALFAQYNADVNFAGCNFDAPSGGPNCNPTLQIGQWVNVLGIAPPPTATSTPTGNETATPTPTFAPPVIINPPEGASARGIVTLRWVSVGRLRSDQYYVVTVRDMTAGSVWSGATRETNLQLPAELVPNSGETHEIEWSVTVGVPTEGGEFQSIAGFSPMSRFRWQSQ